MPTTTFLHEAKDNWYELEQVPQGEKLTYETLANRKVFSGGDAKNLNLLSALKYMLGTVVICEHHFVPSLHSFYVFIQIITLNALKYNYLNMKIVEAVSDMYNLLFAYKKAGIRLCVFNSI